MLNIKETNWSAWLNMVKIADSEKKRPPFRIYKNDLYHIVAVMRLIPPKKNEEGKYDVLETFKSLGDLDTDYGLMSSRQLKDMVSTLNYINRSYIIEKMTENSELATLTPLFLYAQKTQNRISYSSWSDNGISKVLGKALGCLVDFRKTERFTIDVKSTREQALTYRSGAKEGQMEKLTAFKCNKVPGLEEVPTMIMHMLMQTWLANAEVRNIDSMILDPWDWDNIPEPLDEVTPKKKIQHKINRIYDDSMDL